MNREIDQFDNDDTDRRGEFRPTRANDVNVKEVGVDELHNDDIGTK